MWKDKLQNVYQDFDEFSAYSETYGLHERLGYETPMEAWEDNPKVQGSCNPDDFRRVCSKGYRWNNVRKKCVRGK